jgi:hypothetical protein
MSPKDVLEGFLWLPLIVVAEAAVSSLLMHVPNVLEVLLILHLCRVGVGDEEGVMGVTRGMGLRLEERVEVPEGALHVSVGLHLLEAHLQQDLNELLTRLHEMVQVAVL